MNLHHKVDLSWLRYSLIGIILFACSACSPSEKILGWWKTSFNCTSKKGVNVSYTGATSFSANSAEDRGTVTISSTDAQGKITKIVAKVESTSGWFINNNQLTRGGYRSNFTISSVEQNSENLYSERERYSYQFGKPCDSIYRSGDNYYQVHCNRTDDEKQKQKAADEKSRSRMAIGTQAETELEQEAKKYTSQELEISKLNGLEMSLKQKNVEGFNDFNYASVCEKQDFQRFKKGEVFDDTNLTIGISR
jgi:hypothetical protein